MQNNITITTNVIYSKDRGESPKLLKSSISAILEKIKDSNYKDAIIALRKEKDETIQNQMKMKLAGIMFSGLFTDRTDESCISHSGFICLDFDKLDDELEAYKNKLKDDKYTYAMFLSPRGNGIKILVKIPPIIEDHRSHYKAMEAYYGSPKMDAKCINLSRICFISYDPNLYINENSETFTEKVVENEYVNIPKSSNVTVRKLLKWWNKKFGFVDGARNVNCFVLASAFNEYGVPQIEALSIMEDFVRHDFPRYEIVALIKSAYRHRSKFSSKKFDDNTQDEDININVTEYNVDFESIYKSAFIDINKTYTAPPICLSIGEYYVDSNSYPIRFGTYGNFSAIVGASKSKKSFFKSLLISSFIGCNQYYCGNIKTHRKTDGYIIDIDTEQAEYDAHRCFNRVQRMVGGDITDFYKPFALRPYSAKERIQFIDWLIYESDLRKDLLWLSIDGIADLVDNFNDVKESAYAIQKVMEWTNNKNMHLNTVIHSNYGTDKATGHLGTAILKKAETICVLTPEDENVNVKFAYTRGYPIKDFQYGINDSGLPHAIGFEEYMTIKDTYGSRPLTPIRDITEPKREENLIEINGEMVDTTPPF
jgi:hypothetical protein